MSAYNKVLLLGRLTRDPELRVTPSGHSVCQIGLAVSRKYKTAEGEMKEEVTFVDVDAFGRQGESIAKYFTKGKPIFIEGRLKFSQWESNAGEKRSKLTVVLENFQFIGGKEDTGSSSGSGFQNTGAMSGSSSMEMEGALGGNFSDDDDIPF